MSPQASFGIALLALVLPLGLARVGMTYLRSDAFIARHGAEPYQLLVELWPRKVSFYQRLHPRALAALGVAAVVLLAVDLLRWIQR